MRSRSIKSIYFYLIITLISLTLSKNMRFLSTIKVNPIDKVLNDGIISEEFTLETDSDNYFSYDLSQSSSEKNMVITIRNPKVLNLNIDCIVSKSTTDDDVINDFSKGTSICTLYKYYDVNHVTKHNKIINVIASISNYQSGSKLFLKIKSSNGGAITFFIRKTGSYQTEIKSQEISSSYAYKAFEFDYKNYYSKLSEGESLLTSSEKETFLIYGVINTSSKQIDETSVFAISEQSLAAHFYHYEKIIIFIGKEDYDSSSTSNSISISLTKVTDKNTKLYYYTSESITELFLSFHHECPNNDATKYYLIVNYGKLDEQKTYYFKYHSSVGAKYSVADFPPGKTDVTNLSYSEAKKFNTLTKNQYHVHVHRLVCSGDQPKMVINAKYYFKASDVDSGLVGQFFNTDYPHTFGSSDFKLVYLYEEYKGNELSLEIFTPSTEQTKTFKVTFENKNYEINNKYPKVFKITNKSYTSLTISSSEKIETIISSSPSVEKTENPNVPKYLLLNGFFLSDDNIYYTIYEVEHEFDTNYYVDIEINNPTNNVLPICYYLTTTASIQKFAGNCYLLESQKTKNITFSPIFKEVGKDNFNLEEPKYNIMIYNSLQTNDFVVKKVYFRTDLPKSTDINDQYPNKLFKYKDAKLQKNKPSYFNIDILNMIVLDNETHFDLYILNDTSKYTELKIDLECISVYEVGIKYIESYFTEANNICHLINKMDVNSNVYHFIFNHRKVQANERIVIKITPKEDMTVKFLIRTDGLKSVMYDFDFKENVRNILNEPSIYRVYEINQTTISKLDSKKNYLIYDKDIDGLEFYARDKNNFVQIDKGSVLTINPKELSTKYQKYDKFLLLMGKNDCGEKYCNDFSNYQLKHFETLFYTSVKEFKDQQRIPINIKSCRESLWYYVVFNYGKQYKKGNIYVGRYTMYGRFQDKYGYYNDYFNYEDFDKLKRSTLTDFNLLEDNEQHFNVLYFRCAGSLNVYFDYFAKKDYSSQKQIQLQPGSVKYFIVYNKTNLTFNYQDINNTRVKIVNGTVEPIIYFEEKLRRINSDKESILDRTISDKNLFYVGAPEQANIPIRVTTFINVTNLPKTQIDKNLYKIGNKYVYEIPKKAVNVTFYIKRLTKTLRFLEEGDGMELCYNVADNPVLDETGNNCFNVQDNYQLKYDVPSKNDQLYLVMYPTDSKENYEIEKVDPFISDSGESEEEDPVSGDDEDGGTSAWIIIVIILVVLIVLALIGLLIFLLLKKKRVSSEDIEKDNKENTESGGNTEKRPSLEGIN